MRFIIFIKNLILQLVLAINIFALVFPANLFAAEIEITKNISGVGLNTQNSDFPLPKGTILHIPDEFVYRSQGKYLYTKPDGTLDTVKTIDEWLKSAGVDDIENEHGQLDPHYFLRVTVVRAPGALDLKKQMGFVPLNVLAHQDGFKFITIKPSTIRNVEKIKYSKPKILEKMDQSKLEASICIGDCDKKNNSLEQIREALEKANALSKLQTTTNHFLHNYDQKMKSVISKFDSSCFGLKFDDFKKLLIKKSKEKGIPPEIMLGIMTQESGGKCGAIGDWKSERNKSVGLFQISTATAGDYGVKTCNREQLSKLQGATLEEMSSDSSLHCLANPVVNLETSLKVYFDYFKKVNDKQEPSAEKPWNQIANQDSYRKALLAYNGGPGYNFQAMHDMKTASQKLHSDFDKNDWEEFRLFTMRQVLRNNGYLGTAKYNRSLNTSIGSLAYAEAIAGRGHDGQQKGFVDEWQELIEPKNSAVASLKN